MTWTDPDNSPTKRPLRRLLTLLCPLLFRLLLSVKVSPTYRSPLYGGRNCVTPLEGAFSRLSSLYKRRDKEMQVIGISWTVLCLSITTPVLRVIYGTGTGTSQTDTPRSSCVCSRLSIKKNYNSEWIHHLQLIAFYVRRYMFFGTDKWWNRPYKIDIWWFNEL